MPVRFDHIVVLTRDLAEGEAWLTERLGVAPGGGGRHAMMGTHNRLWGLGAGYLELLAVDPEGEHPGRNRWFGLADPLVGDRMTRAPYLATWAVSTDDLAALLARAPAGWGPAEEFARDDLTWAVSIAAGPEMPLGGAWPLMIQWKTGRHPAERLGEQGLGLTGLTIAGAGAAETAAALPDLAAPVRFEPGEGPTRLTATLSTPRGSVTL